MVLQKSPDLTNWSPATTATNLLSQTEQLRSTLMITEEARLFYRLNVTLKP